MKHSNESEYYEILIDDPALTEHGFTRILLPLNGNGKGKGTAAASTVKMVVSNTDKRKMMYPTFYKSDLDKTVRSLRDKIISDDILIDDDTAEGLVAYFRNAGVLLSEDEDSPFFKNGNGNGKTRKSKPTNQNQSEENNDNDKNKDKESLCRSVSHALRVCEDS
jgi:hypothetical protein